MIGLHDDIALPIEAPRGAHVHTAKAMLTYFRAPKAGSPICTFVNEYTRPRLLLTGITALFLATGTAHAVEWQCGPHYVLTIVLHGWPGEEKARQCRDYHILAYPAYNQTREQAGEKSDDEIGLPAKGFRWGLLPHPEFKGQCGLLYRSKPCFQYPIEP
jgi:hypothetical protein